MTDIFTMLERNPYPGRGIAVGRSTDKTSSIIAYFIMGRSENSRNRIFVPEGDGIKTKAHDISKLTDPSLIIYSPVRIFDSSTIVTNGDQTDTIYEHLTAKSGFEDALRVRGYEPDAPNYTPRISAITAEDGSYKLSILKRDPEGSDECQRFFYEYQAVPGRGHFISTYQGDGDPLPSFKGEPVSIATDLPLGEFAERLWASLNPHNKVSLFVRSVCQSSGKMETLIYNKHEGD